LERVTTYRLGDVLNEQERGGDPYLEFLHRRSLEVGVYVLAPEAVDKGEKIHPTEDEVYFVVSGKAILHADGQDYDVASGDVVFVAANTEHWYHSISEQLKLLVFFAPSAPS
jgi:mannose-6-phosphate isomerase-like protein (cupin superfamily)